MIPRHHRYRAGPSRAHDIRSRRRRVTTDEPSRMVGGICTTPTPHHYHLLHTVCLGKTTRGTLAGMPAITVYSTPRFMILCNSVDLHQTQRRLRS